MKIAAFIIIAVTSLFANAGTGYSEIQSLYKHGTKIDLKNLKTADLGIYTGRCFTLSSPTPLGAFAAFLNSTQDSGPIAVDPVLSAIWGSSDNTQEYDTAVVSNLESNLVYLTANPMLDGKTYEVPYQEWSVRFRMNGNYIIQENFHYDEASSYCYYYSFRNR